MLCFFIPHKLNVDAIFSFEIQNEGELKVCNVKYNELHRNLSRHGSYESGCSQLVVRYIFPLVKSDLQAHFYRCDRANVIRSVLGSTGIQISTGGGTDLPTSTQSQFFRCRILRYSAVPIHLLIGDATSCPNIQIIALHDYNLDPTYVASHVDAVKGIALSSGKRLLYEEFGALGSNKQSQILTVTNLLIAVNFFLLSVSQSSLTCHLLRPGYRGCTGR